MKKPKLDPIPKAHLYPSDTSDTYGTRMAELLLDPKLSTLRVSVAAEGTTGMGEFIHAEGFRAKLMSRSRNVDGFLGPDDHFG